MATHRVFGQLGHSPFALLLGKAFLVDGEILLPVADRAFQGVGSVVMYESAAFRGELG